MKIPESSVDKLLRTAIEQKRLIRLRYKNKDRIVEPHDYGIKNGTAKLLAYQVAGSSSGKLPNWRWMETDLISDLQLLNQTFPGGRPPESGQHHRWGELFIRVGPAQEKVAHQPVLEPRQAIALPLDEPVAPDSASIGSAITALGYPRFQHRRGSERKNPASVLVAALTCDDLEVRIIEALPWLAVQYYDLNWDWVIRTAKQRHIRNRLGFIVTLAARVAASADQQGALDKLRQIEKKLKWARTAREDTLCQESMAPAERDWLRKTRSDAARSWELLTDVDFEPSLLYER